MQENTGVTITQKEAQEYCAYKRQKKTAEITSAMASSEGTFGEEDNVERVCERAVRLRQASVRMTPVALEQKGGVFLRNGIKIDCIIGGNGETFVKAKAYEAKRALRLGAKELTLVLTPSYAAAGRYVEIRKELRRMRRAAGKAILKVRLERSYPSATLSRLLRTCAEMRIDYLSVPYYTGCERLQAELTGGCKLEVSGIDSVELFKKTIGAGIRRVVCSNAWDIYTEWLKEVDKITLQTPTVAPSAPLSASGVKEANPVATSPSATPSKATPPTALATKTTALTILSPAPQGGRESSETDYRCRVEGTRLKFF